MSEHLSSVRQDALLPIKNLGFSGVEGNRLLASLPSADFELLAPYLDSARFDQGSVLHEAGQSITHAYFLESGLVSLLAVLPDGHAIDTESIGREGAIGLMAGLGAQKAFARAVVLTPGSAAQIPVAHLAGAAARSKEVRDMIVRYTDGLLERAQTILACNAVHHVSQRMCRWLLQAHERSGDGTIALTQHCLASVLGVQRTTVTMIGRELQARGIIKVHRGRIQIRDLAALERRACTCGRNGHT